MNRLFLICATGLLAFMFPLAGIAQSYDRLWKEVEETRKKDLPQTLISQVNQIYEKVPGCVSCNHAGCMVITMG